MSESRVDNVELTRSVVDHIEAHAARWLGSGEPASVVVAGVDDRPQSVQLRLGVRAGGAARELIVKSPKAVTGVARSGRLVTPVSDPLEKSRLELAALTVMADHFSALADPRFGWVEVFDGLDDPPAIVVGRVGGTTFDEVLRRPRRFAAVASPASVAANLGAWLVEYHSLSTPRAVVRDSSAEEVIAGIAMLADTVAAADRRPSLPPRLGERVRPWAARALDSAPRLGLGHGDLAPRNVFVGDGGKVTVIDSLGRFRVPIHEDLAYFLVDLLVGGGRARRRGGRGSGSAPAAVRAGLLAGYGVADDEVLEVFELRALLDKWRSLVQRGRSRDPRGRALAVVDRARRLVLRRRVEAILRRVPS